MGIENIVIRQGLYSGKIYARYIRKNKNGLSLWRMKTDVTEQCIQAVFSKFIDEAESKDSEFTIESKIAKITVRIHLKED